MTSTTVTRQGGTSDEGYHHNLGAVAQHNALTSTEEYEQYHSYEDTGGLGISNHDDYGPVVTYQDDSYLHTPPTPRSNTASEGIRTRSGRSMRRTDSPYSGSSTRISKSPQVRSKKEKKGKDKSKAVHLDAPLSELTKDSPIPLKDMEAWVNRPAETRRQEVEKRNGYVTRPMNSFMLYRSAYAERTKLWCQQNNHQVVSSASGISWPMEPPEVRDQFNEWAKMERANHQAAHPEYKFSPSKSTAKKRKGEFSEDEDDVSELDGDPDGEYRASGRNVRQRRPREQQIDPGYLPSTLPYEMLPYYNPPPNGYDQYGYAQQPRPVPSNYTDGTAHTWNVATPSGYQNNMQYGYTPDLRAQTPQPMNGAPTVGTYGLPGSHIPGDDLFANSRTTTPMQQHYNQYGQLVYPPYQPQPQQQYAPPPAYQPSPQQRTQQSPTSQYLQEHQAYLEQAAQPQTAVDPALDYGAQLESQANMSHFHDAMGAGLADEPVLPEYFQESTSPNQTLAPARDPADGLDYQ